MKIIVYCNLCCNNNLVRNGSELNLNCFTIIRLYFIIYYWWIKKVLLLSSIILSDTCVVDHCVLSILFYNYCFK